MLYTLLITNLLIMTILTILNMGEITFLITILNMGEITFLITFFANK
jgi:hypothetical protein